MQQVASGICINSVVRWPVPVLTQGPRGQSHFRKVLLSLEGVRFLTTQEPIWNSGSHPNNCVVLKKNHCPERCSTSTWAGRYYYWGELTDRYEGPLADELPVSQSPPWESTLATPGGLLQRPRGFCLFEDLTRTQAMGEEALMVWLNPRGSVKVLHSLPAPGVPL